MPAPNLVVGPTPELIDRYGELDRRVRQFKPTADEHEKLKNTLKSFYDTHPAAETALAVGTVYEIQVSAKSNERKIGSVMKVYKALGSLAKFFAVVAISLTKLEEAIGKTEAAKLVVEDRTGSRRLTTVARATPAEQKEAA